MADDQPSTVDADGPGGDGLAVHFDVRAEAEVIPGPERLAHTSGYCDPEVCDLCAHERGHGGTP